MLTGSACALLLRDSAIAEVAGVSDLHWHGVGRGDERNTDQGVAACRGVVPGVLTELEQAGDDAQHEQFVPHEQARGLFGAGTTPLCAKVMKPMAVAAGAVGLQPEQDGVRLLAPTARVIGDEAPLPDPSLAVRGHLETRSSDSS